MTGVLFLVPGLPDGTWLVGLGLLMLGGNATRLYIGLPLDRFGVIIGAGALVAGLGAMAGIEIPVFALGLIAVRARDHRRPAHAGTGRTMTRRVTLDTHEA